MPRKLKDAVVKTGTYEDSMGNTKGRYTNVGALMESDDGGRFLLLNRHFNPAGVPNPKNQESVIVSLFDPQQRQQQSGPAQQSSGSQSGSADDFDNDIPI